MRSPSPTSLKVKNKLVGYCPVDSASEIDLELQHRSHVASPRLRLPLPKSRMKREVGRFWPTILRNSRRMATSGCHYLRDMIVAFARLKVACTLSALRSSHYLQKAGFRQSARVLLRRSYRLHSPPEQMQSEAPLDPSSAQGALPRRRLSHLASKRGGNSR
jgi:hypothetical protein